MDLLRSDWDPFKNAHRYEVEINAHPDRLLDWDKSIDQQSPFIQDAVTKAVGEKDMYPSMTGGTAVDVAGTLGPGTRRYGGEAALGRQGILGVKYADQLSRGAGTAPTQNYSIWRDNNINIVRKYGIGALGTVGAGDAMMHAAPLNRQQVPTQ